MRGIINTAADALILGLLFLSAVLSIYTAIAVFPLNPYWIELLGDYSGGFVRRFLLGEILNNIPGVPPEIAGLTVLTACYVFVTASLYAGVRRLNLPLFLRILVLLSPSGVASYLLVPNQAMILSVQGHFDYCPCHSFSQGGKCVFQGNTDDPGRTCPAL